MAEAVTAERQKNEGTTRRQQVGSSSCSALPQTRNLKISTSSLFFEGKKKRKENKE